MNNEFWATIAAITPIAKETFEATFSLSENEFKFKAGQYVWVVLQQLATPDPKGEQRAFSITSSEFSPDKITIQFRSSESGYKKTLLKLPLGTTVKIIGPFGSSYVPTISQKMIVMVAGGVGMAPFLSILRSLGEKNAERLFVLIYINSSPETGVFYNELNNICKEHNFPFVNHVGEFRENILPSIVDFSNDTFFICGPAGMVDSVYAVLKTKNVPFDHMRFEQHYPTKPENLTEDHFKPKPGEDIIMLRAINDSRNHVVVTDANGQIIFANKTAQEKTGYTFDEMRGNTPRLWGAMMDQEFYKSFWHNKMTSDGFDGEIINRRKNGEQYQALVHISTMYDSSKNIIGYIGTEEDVSKLKKIQEDLQHQNETIQADKIHDDAIINSVGDALIITDKDGKVVQMNKNAEELTSLLMEDSRGKSLSQVLPILDMNGNVVSMENRPMTEVFNKKEKVIRDIIFMHPKRGKLIFNLTATPVLLWGNIIGVIDLLRDVTEEKAIDRMKTDFISLASHQLRTPLTSISWYCEMLLSGDAGQTTDEQTKFVQEVYDGSQRMVKLVNALLNVSRIEAGTYMISPESVNVAHLTRCILNESRPQIDEKKLTVNLEKEEIPDMQLDPNLMTIILQNLLTNSIKYTREGGSINIYLKIVKKGTVMKESIIDQDSLLIQIEDNGIGVPYSQKNQVFQKMFRADNARKASSDGNGLGLYQTSSLIVHAKGKIWFESEEDKGTTFFVLLPLSGMVKREGTKKIDMEKEVS